MKVPESTHSAATLRAHVEKHVALLETSIQEILDAERLDIPLLGKTHRSAVLLAGLLENYYTCAETIFVRVSQFFENQLSPERWHRDLLENMTLVIEGERPRLLLDSTHQDLLELMRFRHFRRYYFGTAYDWERLEALLKRVKRVHQPLIADIQKFQAFLKALEQSD